MDAPTPQYTIKPNNEKKFNLEYNNNNYILVISSNNSSIKFNMYQQDKLDNYIYEEILTLDQLKEINNSFNIFNSVEAARNSIEKILNNNKGIISQKDINNFVLTLKIYLFEEILDVNIILKKKEMNQKETIPILFQKIQQMNDEIINLKKENEKIKQMNDEIINLKKENEKIKLMNDEIINLKKENAKIKQMNDERIELKKYQNKPNSNDYKFKFKIGINYSLNENRTIATKINGGNDWNCSIIGDTEIPKNKITKWKIRLNEFKMTSGNSWDVLIGIGPDNPNNITYFHHYCWSFICGESNLSIKSGGTTIYNKYGELKNGDVVEVIVDRIQGNLSFAVNEINFGIACSNIPFDMILFPVVCIHDEFESVEIIE